ncbi:peptidylprolyl isomerase [Chloroflexota bacterium]
MAKKKAEKPHREVNKHQLSRWEKQKKRQRIIFGVGLAIIVVVLATVGVGWYLSQYKPMHQTVFRVNNTEFDMGYYIKTLKLIYSQSQYSSTIEYLADEVATAIQRNELMRQEAAELSISISDDEVDKELKERDPPVSKDYRDIIRAGMLSDKLVEEYFDAKVPVSAEQRHIMAMFLESESQVAEVRARAENGEDFGELAAELSLDSFTKSENGDMGWKPEGIIGDMWGGEILEEHAFSIEKGILSQPIYEANRAKEIGYWLVKVLERGEDVEEAHVQVILLGSAEEAQSVRDRLEAGENFGVLAKEMSQHEASKESEGDLGWLTPNELNYLDDFIFDLSIEEGTISEPIRDDVVITAGGYWLLKVVDIDNNRDIEEEDRDLLKTKALDDWSASLWDDPQNEIESFLDEEKRSWAILQALK